MFKVTALIYMLMSGTTLIDEPLAIESKQTFSSLEKCQAYLQSDEFGAARENITAAVTAAIKQANLQNGDEQPTVAITASCDPDNRL